MIRCLSIEIQWMPSQIGKQPDLAMTRNFLTTMQAKGLDKCDMMNAIKKD